MGRVENRYTTSFESLHPPRLKKRSYRDENGEKIEEGAEKQKKLVFFSSSNSTQMYKRYINTIEREQASIRFEKKKKKWEKMDIKTTA